MDYYSAIREMKYWYMLPHGWKYYVRWKEASDIKDLQKTIYDPIHIKCPEQEQKVERRQKEYRDRK